LLDLLTLFWRETHLGVVVDDGLLDQHR
jgi:hypothetical protein